MTKEERNAPNIRLFPVNWLSTKASTKLSTGGFSEWQFHFPGFFFRDFLKTVPLRRGLVDTLPAFLRTVFLIPLRAFVGYPAPVSYTHLSELAPFLNILNEMHARQTSKKVKAAMHTRFANGDVYKRQ